MTLQTDITIFVSIRVQSGNPAAELGRLLKISACKLMCLLLLS
ncbi:hypothetical protein FG05_35035 [Fusarium graminearum]|nr:hypothetical protein FG05_35035 [Fusarium graminearum]